MSLFKLKHLWIQSFPEHEFDEHHLSIDEIDNKPALALGNYTGKLDVYIILIKNQFKVNCIYSTNFDGPIVAVQFVDYSETGWKNCVGVLLERKFVYVMLKANAAGGYDNRHVAINIQPSFAIQPGSLSTMTLNSSIQYLNPISKQPLKVSDPIYSFSRKVDYLYYNDGQQLVLLQNTTEQWRIIVGPIRNIFTLQNGDEVILIGDNALWQVLQSRIIKTKVIEEDVSCGTVVEIQGQGRYNVLVADFKNRVFVYDSQFRLIWAIKVNQVPIKMLVFKGMGLNGAIAILGEEGSVSISYLGSEVPETQIQPLNEQIDMQEVEQQTKKLLSQLKLSQDSVEQAEKSTAQTSNSSSLSVKLHCSPPQGYPSPLEFPQQYFHHNGQPWSCQLICQLNTRQSIYDICVSAEAPTNITFLEKQKKIANIKVTAEKVRFIMLCSSQKFAYGNFVEVIIKYRTDKSQSLSIITEKHELPLNFQCSLKSLQLQQKPTNKIVFKAQTDLPQFSQIFHELGPSLSNTKNITIKLPNGVLCSIGYNKNNTKVKLQSNFFSALCFLFVVFFHRFKELVRVGKIGKNQLSIDDIPLEQFFNLMKDHYSLRIKLKQQYQQLQQKSEQFRNAQKKLLIKMKQKASSINNLDKLLQYTYNNIIKSADKYEQVRDQLQTVNHNLEIALTFILQLLFMKTKATPKCREKVFGIIGYERESMEYGWEEKMLANSAFYLNKKFNYNVDKFTFDQLYKTALWVISKINSGDWNE